MLACTGEGFSISGDNRNLPDTLHLQGFCKAMSWRLPYSASPLTGSCPCVQTRQVSTSDSPCSQTDYADDAVLFTEDDAQWTYILESFDAAANTMGLHTSWAKTNIHNVASVPSPSSCVIWGHQVEAVSRFTYLGSHVDLSGYCTPEILRSSLSV